MTTISYYEINVNFSTGKLMSVETNSTHVTFLPPVPENLKETNNTNITLQPESFNYTITIVVYNSEGMISQSTSKSFGMNI